MEYTVTHKKQDVIFGVSQRGGESVHLSGLKQYIAQRRWQVLVITLLLSAAVLLILLGRAFSWSGRTKDVELLTVVGPQNPVPDELNLAFTLLENSEMVDSRCAEALNAMLSDCRAEGLTPQITASFRTREGQTALYNDEVRSLVQNGLTEEEARIRAAETVGTPGASEHELGLAVDIRDAADLTDVEGAAVQWLHKNAWRYGFVLRYPEGKESVTGYSYQPFHFRYVGPDAAEQIDTLGITLEEYVEMFYS